MRPPALVSSRLPHARHREGGVIFVLVAAAAVASGATVVR